MSIYGVKNLSAHYDGKKHAKNVTDGQVRITKNDNLQLILLWDREFPGNGNWFFRKF